MELSRRSGTSAASLLLFAFAASCSQTDGASDNRRVHNNAVPVRVCDLRFVDDIVLGSRDIPANQAFGDIVDYAIGDDGTMFILDSLDPAVHAFGSDGRFRRRIGRVGRGPGEFERPYRIAVAGDAVVVYDTGMNRFVRFDTAGNHKATHASPFYTDTNFEFVLSRNGRILIAMIPASVPAPRQIHEFDASFNLVRSFGEPPAAALLDPGNTVHAGGSLHVEPDGSVWFSPLQDYQIRRYDADGGLILTIGRDHDIQFNPRPLIETRELEDGRSAIGFDLNRALSTALTVDSAGLIWHFTRDVPNDRIVADIFDQAGTFIATSAWTIGQGPAAMDAARRCYRISRDSGFAQLQRYRLNSSTGGTPC